MIHIMFDLETWGKRPGCDIRSIGATVFDPIANTVNGDALKPGLPTPNGAFYIAVENPAGRWRNGVFEPELATGDEDYRKYPLTRDPETVEWWSKQSAEAQAAFAHPIDLRAGLVAFGKWLMQFDLQTAAITTYPWFHTDQQMPPKCNYSLWSHGPAFDPPIAVAAFEACGLPVPWHYRAPRDTRTAFDLAGIRDHSAWLQQYPGPLGIDHHALDDAICQARGVCGAIGRIRQWSDYYNEGCDDMSGSGNPEFDPRYRN